MAVIVIKDKKTKNTKGLNVSISVNTKGMFKDMETEKHPYRNIEKEKEYRIDPDASYRPLEYVKKMGW